MRITIVGVILEIIWTKNSENVHWRFYLVMYLQELEFHGTFFSFKSIHCRHNWADYLIRNRNIQCYKTRYSNNNRRFSPYWNILHRASTHCFCLAEFWMSLAIQNILFVPSLTTLSVPIISLPWHKQCDQIHAINTTSFQKKYLHRNANAFLKTLKNITMINVITTTTTRIEAYC